VNQKQALQAYAGILDEVVPAYRSGFFTPLEDAEGIFYNINDDQQRRFPALCLAIQRNVVTAVQAGRDLAMALSDEMRSAAVIGCYLSEGANEIIVDPKTEDAVQHMDLHFTASDYHQPFSVTGIQLKDAFLLSHWEADARRLMILCFTGNKVPLICGFLTRLDPGQVFEKVFDGVAPDPEVPYAEEQTFRLAVNVCMYAAHCGRVLDKESGGYRSKVEERLARAIKRGDRRKEESNRKELALIPVRYTLDQSVPLYREETAPSEPGEATGRMVAPHWRRGHWRHQRHGPGGTLVKLIPIAAVLVNGANLLGDRSESKVTYR
jgi:hypothetical protein